MSPKLIFWQHKKVIKIEEISTDCLGLFMMEGGTWEATDSIYISKSAILLNPMAFRMTPKGKLHELKGKPFCTTLSYPSVGDGQTGNGGSGIDPLGTGLEPNSQTAI